LVARSNFAADTVVNVGGMPIGDGRFQVIAGPCAVESRCQLERVVSDLIACGVGIIRAGAYKPRTSPYDFQGLGDAALDLLAEVKARSGVRVVTEVLDPDQIERVAAVADMLQIGARNGQNFRLLERVAEAGLPVLLKRGPSATFEEWVCAAEYLLVNGCRDVVLCERGIRTFETATRNTLDVAAVALAKRETHLPVIVDPSHAAGRLDLVLPLALAGVAAGADGILVEAHPDPAHALSDAAQQIPSAEFTEFLGPVLALASGLGKRTAGPVSRSAAGPRLRSHAAHTEW
jgi:3-deoxy-7-phosphoheptulonate synthase